MCRSNEISAVPEDNDRSDDDWFLIQIFDSCEEFEIMSIKAKQLQFSRSNSRSKIDW